MFLKIFILSVILVALTILALGIKLLFDKNAEFTMHSCAPDSDKTLDKDDACVKCDLNDLVNCTENKEQKI